MAGTLSNPISFEKCMSTNQIMPGDVLLKKTREINEIYTFKTSGEANKLITWKPLAGNTFKLNGGLNVTGKFSRFENLEVYYNKWTSRTTSQSGSNPTDIPILTTLSLNAEGIELYRCVIHDTANALGVWSSSKNVVFTECIIFNNGWIGPDRGHGHGVYNQNIEGTQIFNKCIIFNNYGCGVHSYSGSRNCTGFEYNDCIIFENGVLNMYYEMLVGGISTDIIFDQIKVKRCEVYGTQGIGLSAGYLGIIKNSEISDNYIVDWQAFVLAQNDGTVIVSGNVFYSHSINQVIQFDNNICDVIPSSGSRYKIIQCDSIRAHVVIYNFASNNTIQIDCSSFLMEGDAYKLTNVQDLSTDIVTGTVGSGGLINVSMTSHTVATPFSGTAFTSTFPKFGCFILEKI